MVTSEFILCPQLEAELVKLKESARKSLDPKIFEKIDELEKEFKKQTAEAKTMFEDKVGKPVNDKYKDDVKKFTESVLKSTKDIEVSVVTVEQYTFLFSHKPYEIARSATAIRFVLRIFHYTRFSALIVSNLQLCFRPPSTRLSMAWRNPEFSVIELI